MPSLNKVTLIGNLTRDPEMRYTPKGTAVAEITLACNRKWTDEGGNKKEECTFVDCVLWGKQAELAGQYLHKGSCIYLEGRLNVESWEDKTTGQKRSRMRVVGEHMQFLDGKPEGQQQQQQQRPATAPRQAQAPARRAAPSPEPAPFEDDGSEIPY